jgi:hypothetical protein
MKNTVLRIFDLIKKGELKFMIKGISKRIWSKTEAFGLKRDLSTAFDTPKAKIDLLIRPFKPEDDTHFTADLQNDGLIEKDIPTCYVATTNANAPCYRQWLMDSKQNKKIKEFWGESFPTLQNNEALIESVFTISEFRGKGIMPAALDQIAKQIRDSDIRYLMLFVELDNIASLKGSHRSGFSPFVLRTEKWFFMKRTIVFEEVSSDVMDDYLKNVSS